MFNQYLYQPILSTLLFLSGLLGNLGLSIIVLTLLIRLILLPLTLPALKAAGKMKELQPEIKKLKEKFKDDPAAQQRAQLQLFQEHKVNPAAGCLPYLLQFVVLIALYRVFIDFLSNGDAAQINANFLWLDLTKPDPLYLLPAITGLVQLVLGLMVMPATSTAAEKTLATQTATKKDDKAADDMSTMAATMQQQMIFVMPIMTVFLALRFPAGLGLYWAVTTFFSVVQQYVVSGWGGLKPALQRVVSRFSPRP